MPAVRAVSVTRRRRRRLEVEVTPLGRLPRAVVGAIRTEADELRRLHGAEDMRVVVAAG